MTRRATTAWSVAALALLTAATPVSRQLREQAYRQNNRGVGLLEQFRHEDAASAFRQAVSTDPELAIARVNLAIALFNLPDLPAALHEARLATAANPDAPQAYYVLGLLARGLSNSEEAKTAFQKVLAFDPRDVGANVNLGQLFLQERNYEAAMAAFRTALDAEPYNATAAYNLGLALTRSGAVEEAQRMMERFRTLRESGYGTLIGQAYPEQGRYAAAIASTGAEADLVDSATPPVRFVDATARAFPSTPEATSGSPGAVLLFDLDADGDLDLFEASSRGQRLYRNDAGRFVDVTRRLGLDPARGGVGAVAGDLDNDGRPDLLVLRAGGVSLHHNEGTGLLDATAGAGLASLGGGLSAALADFDHDGDLDILLDASGSAVHLLQNAGDATFKDVAEAAGLAVAGRVLAAVPTDYDNGRDMDLLEIVDSGPPRLFRNLRDGTFRDVAAAVGLGSLAKPRCVAAADVNKDSYTDFLFGAEEGDLVAMSDGRGRFVVAPAPWGSRGTTSAQFLDYDGDGLLDVVAFSATGARVLRNLGSRWMDLSPQALGEPRGLSVSAFGAGDLDGDGDTDLVVRLSSGALRLFRNEGGNRNASVRVRLAGLVSNRSGIGAKVEIRAGSLAQKLETYAATPAPAPADVVFGLGSRGSADAVRVVWPSGTVQTEIGPFGSPSQEGKAVVDVRELNRKPSSCPFLYAWNGRAFEFITDFMGAGEVGYLEEPGVWNEPNPIEHTRLTDEQLVPRDGRYELRVTDELEEALFVDRLALLAVAHPAGVEVYPYEGMTTPPKPQRLYSVKNARSPIAAVDDHGHDVLGLIARMDRRYPDDFRLRGIRGYSEAHALTLDLGPTAERSVLLLSGWTDYAWSSDNLAAHQAGLVMRTPSLEVEDANGRWVSAIEQVGIPVGRPQTVVADLAGIWKSVSRRVRIVTNMRIYWDQIRVGDVLDTALDSVEVKGDTALLRERGFSAEVTPDGREPFGYDYARVSRGSPWKHFPGRYTREGDVRELLDRSDDAFVIARPGDEIALTFDSNQLPALPRGWRRTFLLFSDGFSKEMDINSATPDVLLPLPFHGMSRYPYAPPEAFPMTAERSRLMELYNTRVVRAPIIGLDTALASAERSRETR